MTTLFRMVVAADGKLCTLFVRDLSDTFCTALSLAAKTLPVIFARFLRILNHAKLFSHRFSAWRDAIRELKCRRNLAVLEILMAGGKTVIS